MGARTGTGANSLPKKVSCRGCDRCDRSQRSQPICETKKRPEVMIQQEARVIVAIAAEADDTFAWDQLARIQSQMFAAGPVAIKFAYFGAEGTSQVRPCITTRWI